MYWFAMLLGAWIGYGVSDYTRAPERPAPVVVAPVVLPEVVPAPELDLEPEVEAPVAAAPKPAAPPTVRKEPKKDTHPWRNGLNGGASTPRVGQVQPRPQSPKTVKPNKPRTVKPRQP